MSTIIKKRILNTSVYSPPDDWPAPLGAAAYHGLAGDIVRTIEPHSEADPAAVLVQLLIAFGSVIGREAHFAVEADKHHLNLFAAMVGATAKARKGVSFAHIRRLFSQVVPEWDASRIKSGLASGEGLTWQLRDADGDDRGVSDKRLFVIDPEFAATLRILGRDGNILSPIIRKCWDGQDLENLTKRNSVRASAPHVSIVAHITQDELRRYLSKVESGNGFANRFLWVCVRRSKLLPDGGRIDETDLDPLIARLKTAVRYARDLGELYRDAEASCLWRRVYPA
ncbi:MAG TPA: DUF3987 domain-containing protein, partial [Alphaproteobacteria bacterium]|nr:DUF3987 domain-containing protein [Alphaproteobacteria bacterium]